MLSTVLTRLLRFALRIRCAGDVSRLEAREPAIYIANHPGPLDPAALASVLPDDVVVVVPPLSLASPICKAALRGERFVALDLSRAPSVRRLVKLVGREGRVLLFPENRPTPAGTATKIYEAAAIVAARTGLPVIPLHLRYGAVGANGKASQGLTLYVGRQARIELPPGLPARERRRQSTDSLLRIMQETAVHARPSHGLFDAFLAAMRQNGRGTRILEDAREIEESYGSILRMALALGRLLSRHTGEGAIVGMLLPNTAAAVGTLLGLSATGRVPAMLNYSAGAESLRASVAVAGIEVVVTSRRFIEIGRLERLLRGLDRCRIVYLEDLRSELRLADKLWLMGWALWMPHRVAVPVEPHARAIVLFTSGSEGRPKGVVLSHDAMLANMAQLAAAIDFGAGDKFLNALPMYHTYGLIACTLMPLCYGTRLFLYTNPLHYRIIPEVAYSRRCTYLFGTSTFLGNYARQAKPMDFCAVRYVISGGEKLNPEVQRLFQERFGLRVLEGYGATECGPAVSLATRQRYRVGTVGRFLPCVEHRLVPVDGIPEGGVLHLKTPNMMMGYLLPDRPGIIQPPASEVGPGWHSMGDVVTVDEDGYVSVLGRLKRFAKVAGEMVALEAVERLARVCSPEHQHAATVALLPDRGETTVLFTTDPALDRVRLHQTARSTGAQDLAVARSIVHVSDLPVLGSGKTDYVRLADLARDAAAAPPVQPVGSEGARASGRGA